MKHAVLSRPIVCVLFLLIVALPSLGIHAQAADLYVTAVDWSPDGTFIAIAGIRVSEAGYASYLRVIDVVSSATTLALDTRDGGGFTDVKWRPGTLEFAVTDSQGAVGLWRLNPQGAFELYFAWSDGTKSSSRRLLRWNKEGSALAIGELASTESAGNLAIWHVSGDSATLITRIPLGMYDIATTQDGFVLSASNEAQFIDIDGSRRISVSGFFPVLGDALGMRDVLGVEMGFAATQVEPIRIVRIDRAAGTGANIVTSNKRVSSLAWLTSRHAVVDHFDGAASIVDTQTGEIINTLSLPRRGGRWLMDVSPYGGRIVLGSSAPTGIEPAGGIPLSPGVEVVPGTPLLFVVPLPTLEALSGVLERCEIDSPTRAQIDTVSAPDAIPAFIAQVEALPEGAIPPACKADLLAVARAVVEADEK